MVPSGTSANADPAANTTAQTITVATNFVRRSIIVFVVTEASSK